MKTAKTKKRNFSPAQLRAQARFAKAAKAGTLKRKKRNATIIKAKKISHLDVSRVHNGLAASKKRKPAKRNGSVSTKLYNQLLRAENAYGRLADKFGPQSKQAEKAWKLVNTISDRIRTDQLKQNPMTPAVRRAATAWSLAEKHMERAHDVFVKYHRKYGLSAKITQKARVAKEKAKADYFAAMRKYSAVQAASEKTAKNPKRKNAEHRDAQHPIHVRDYWQGRRGYKSQWQRAHEAGQRQLFGVKNPGMTADQHAVQKAWEAKMRASKEWKAYEKALMAAYEENSPLMIKRADAAYKKWESLVKRTRPFTWSETQNRYIAKKKNPRRNADNLAYRGYLIKHNAIHNTWYISHGGQHVGSASSLAAAKKAIDELTGTKNPRRGTRRLTARYKKLRTEARKGTGSGALLNEKMAKTGKIIATRHLRGKRQASAVTKRNGSHTTLARKRRAEFVGRPSTKLKTLYAPNGSGASGTLSQLGKLHKIKVKGGKEYNFKGVPVLAQHPKTDQLFVLGKNYTVNVPKKNPGDRMVDLGEVRTIEYEAVKTHLGDTKPVRYYHHFGEEGGERPHALVNEEGLVLFSGGDYYIRPEGIRD